MVSNPACGVFTHRQDGIPSLLPALGIVLQSLGRIQRPSQGVYPDGGWQVRGSLPFTEG